jgi:PTH1 family peptidyl-tRNA hydrolase
MKLIVGLGNPGKEYLLTRHNAGFLFLDTLVDSYNIPDYKAKFQGAFTEGAIHGHHLFFLKPLTYMNLSGGSVATLCRFYKIPAEEVLVIHDDVDVALGKIKLKQGGGTAGHNGLKSLTSSLGSENFWRLRIGIDRKPDRMELSDYVLSNLPKSDLSTLQDLLEGIARNFDLLLEGKDSLFLTNVAEGK